MNFKILPFIIALASTIMEDQKGALRLDPSIANIVEDEHSNWKIQ